MPLACSDDLGKDKPTAENLLSRHQRLCEEVQAYAQDITRLEELAAELSRVQVASDAVVEQVHEPRVRVLYAYDGHGISVKKGQVCFGDTIYG